MQFWALFEASKKFQSEAIPIRSADFSWGWGSFPGPESVTRFFFQKTSQSHPARRVGGARGPPIWDPRKIIHTTEEKWSEIFFSAFGTRSFWWILPTEPEVSKGANHCSIGAQKKESRQLLLEGFLQGGMTLVCPHFAIPALLLLSVVWLTPRISSRQKKLSAVHGMVAVRPLVSPPSYFHVIF